jgi:hypothetical protein
VGEERQLTVTWENRTMRQRSGKLEVGGVLDWWFVGVPERAWENLVVILDVR